MQMRRMYVVTAPYVVARRGQKLHIFAMDSHHAKHIARTQFGWDHLYLSTSGMLSRAEKIALGHKL